MHFHGDGSSSRRGGRVLNFAFVEGGQKRFLGYTPEGGVWKRSSAVARCTIAHHRRCRQTGMPRGQAADTGMRVLNGSCGSSGAILVSREEGVWCCGSGAKGKWSTCDRCSGEPSVPAPWTMRREVLTTEDVLPTEDGSKWLARALCLVRRSSRCLLFVSSTNRAVGFRQMRERHTAVAEPFACSCRTRVCGRYLYPKRKSDMRACFRWFARAASCCVLVHRRSSLV